MDARMKDDDGLVVFMAILDQEESEINELANEFRVAQARLEAAQRKRAHIEAASKHLRAYLAAEGSESAEPVLVPEGD